MGFLTIASNNPQFSFILKKNPNSGMMMRSVRKGVLNGWYPADDQQTFCCYFKDSDFETSYSMLEDTNDFVDVTRYNSPLFVLNTIQEFFSHNLKTKMTEDGSGFNNVLCVNMMFLKNHRYVSIFTGHFDKFEIEVEPLVGKNYKIIFKTQESLYHLLNFVALFTIFNALRNGDVIDRDGVIDKYLGCLSVSKSPYFVVYNFKTHFLHTRELFNKYKTILESVCLESVEFTNGDTGVSRRDAVRQQLSFDNAIVDIGCGSGFYLFDFIKRMKNPVYYAIDRDNDVRESLTRKIELKELDVVVLESVDEFLQIASEKCDFIMAEVIEHMEKSDAKLLIEKVLSYENFNSLILTTPDRDFNKYYLLDEEELRVSDHVFEFNKAEFLQWLSFVPGEFKVEFDNIGDIVNGVSVSLLAVIRKI